MCTFCMLMRTEMINESILLFNALLFICKKKKNSKLKLNCVISKWYCITFMQDAISHHLDFFFAINQNKNLFKYTISKLSFTLFSICELQKGKRNFFNFHFLFFCIINSYRDIFTFFFARIYIHNLL